MTSIYFLSYMDTCIAIIMYCQMLFCFTGKQHCLQTNKYDQFRGVTEIYSPTKSRDLKLFRFQDMSVESEEEDELRR